MGRQLLLQGHVNVPGLLQDEALLLPALAGGLNALADHVHRPLDGAEQPQQGGAGEDHHRHKEQQHNDNPGAHQPGGPHQGQAQQAAQHTAAGPGVFRVEMYYVLPEV